MKAMFPRLILAALVTGLLVTGCKRLKFPAGTESGGSTVFAVKPGGSPSQKQGNTPAIGPRNAQKDLEKLGDYLLEHETVNGRPAASGAELATTVAKYDAGLAAALQAGVYVIRAGISAKTNEDPILAYEKDVPTKGGWVLWDVAVVTKETAKDFNKAISQRKK